MAEVRASRLSYDGKAGRAAEQVVRRLQEAGHKAYFAGGCVRDMLLGSRPVDFDVATDARPERVQDLFSNSRLVGEAFGVVLVRMWGYDIEVATFRTEWGYRDGRRPDRVQFSDDRHDAQRRDFTVNGMFYDPVAERLIDYVGGLKDIQRRVIRCIGDPDSRFDEDYLRMLRAVRFSARLGWEIEPRTAQAIVRHARLLERISRERIGMEVQMMLEDAGRAKAVALMGRLGLDGVVLKEEPCRDEPVVLAGLAGQVDYPTALAAWALDRHLERGAGSLVEAAGRLKVAMLVRRWRAALVLSNEHSARLGGLLEQLKQFLRWPELDVARRKRLLAGGQWPALRQLAGALPDIGGEMDLGHVDREVAELFEQGVAPEPLINGDDLIAEGFSPGPAFKRILEAVYDAQLRGQIELPEQALVLARRVARQAGADRG